MKPICIDSRNRLRQAALVALLALLALQFAGCGGGVGTGGTGTYAAGPITGFGSIIVNDVHFDESTAAVVDDDDGVRQRSELKLGMTVEIDGDTLRSDSGATAFTATATASRVRFGSEIVGPVQSVNATTGVFTVLGQTVRIAVETVFDERLVGGIAALSVGQVLEVYALYDADRGAYNATRIEPRSGGATQWRLRGPVGALDRAAGTLRIGSGTFAFGAAGGVPADLAPGKLVRLRLTTTLDATGRFSVADFGVALRPPQDRDEARLRGLVTQFSSSVSFQVNGLPVDASAAAFPNGSAGLRLGARVEAKGSARSGVLVAGEVKVETDDEVRDRGFEFKGNIDSVDAAARTFTLRGQTVVTTRADLRLEGGTLADITVGRRVEVRAQLATDRTHLEATRIKFD